MTWLIADRLSDQASQKIYHLLTDAGYQAWFVGGCVRDALLARPVADIDLATDARPETVMQLAQTAGIKAVPTGLAHGTVTVVVDDTPYEITTFRRDVVTDGRRATVAFSKDMRDDARRRDFTINALYAGTDGQVADPLGGIGDLWAHRIRFIDDPAQRIREDYLRILRFFRFYAWYGDAATGPDRDGLAACAANIAGLQSLSVERVTAELLKLLAAPDPAPAAAAMAATGVLGQVLPGADARCLAVLIHLEEGLRIAPCPLRRLAVMGGDTTMALRLSKQQTRVLDQITSGAPPVEIAYRHGAIAGRDSLLVQSALSGQPVEADDLTALETAAAQVFPLQASDMMPALSGPALGRALKQAEARWIASHFTLTKADLLDR